MTKIKGFSTKGLVNIQSVQSNITPPPPPPPPPPIEVPLTLALPSLSANDTATKSSFQFGNSVNITDTSLTTYGYAVDANSSYKFYTLDVIQLIVGQTYNGGINPQTVVPSVSTTETFGSDTNTWGSTYTTSDWKTGVYFNINYKDVDTASATVSLSIRGRIPAGAAANIPDNMPVKGILLTATHANQGVSEVSGKLGLKLYQYTAKIYY